VTGLLCSALLCSALSVGGGGAWAGAGTVCRAVQWTEELIHTCLPALSIHEFMTAGKGWKGKAKQSCG
jgi:hypothetical protein